MSWQPLLDGERRERALAAVHDIDSALRSTPVAEASVAGGKAGHALMYAYLEQAGLGDGERADALLGEAVDAVAEQPMGSSLYSGFTGIAWAAEHVSAASDDEDPNEDIDAALHEHLTATPWVLDYDLIIGLVGYGVYGLERARRPGGRRTMELVVDRLAESAVALPPSPGRTWWTSPDLMISETREQNPKGYYNTGLAHGSPGAIALLGHTIAAGVAVDRARPLLDDAVAWLLAQRAERPGGAVFPYTVTVPPEEVPTPVRAAWCYGDPGVAIALLAAARAVNEPRWEAIALDVGRRVARRDLEHCGVRDASLCHGAIGLAHIYNRFWQATRDPAFRDAALLWTDRGLGMRKPGEGLAGFLAWTPTGNGMELGWMPDPGLLTGVAGIGLALVGLVSEHEPRWDRLLLTDVAPVG